MIEQGGMPKWLVAIVLVLIVVFGSMWTMHRRKARENVDLKAIGKAKLNQINNDGLKMRQRMQDEAERRENERLKERSEYARTQANRPATYPFSLTEEEARRLVQSCPELAERGKVELPKQYSESNSESVFREYPALFNAQRSRLLFIDREDGVVKHRVGITGGIIIKESAHLFEVDLGRRNITRINQMTGTADRVSASFTWSWEYPAAAEVLLDIRQMRGDAVYLRQGGVWRLTGASISDGKESIGVCR
ncbi:MAG TPA: hypothetical protein VF787_05420 [Thermoanaerobaculia bacterium]